MTDVAWNNVLLFLAIALLIFRVQLLLTAKKGTPISSSWPFKRNNLTSFVIFIAVWLVKEQILKAYFWLGIWSWNSKTADVMFKASNRICLVCSLCKETGSATSRGLHLGMDKSPEVRFNSLAHCLSLGSLQFRFYFVAGVPEVRTKTSFWNRT